MTSSTWSLDFISKRFLVRTIHIKHVIKVLMSSVVSFYQGLALIQVSTPFHMWKLRFHVVCASPFKPCMYTELKLRTVKTRLKISKSWKTGYKVELNLFLNVIFLIEFHLNRIFSNRDFSFLFPKWILKVIKKSSFYLLRERPKTYSEFRFLCLLFKQYFSKVKPRNLFPDTFFIILNPSHF